MDTRAWRLSDENVLISSCLSLLENCGLALCVIGCSSSSHCGGSVTDAQWLNTPCWAACVGLWGMPEMDMVWGVRIASIQRAAPALSASHIPPSGDRSPSLHLPIRSPICPSCPTENTWLAFMTAYSWLRPLQQIILLRKLINLKMLAGRFECLWPSPETTWIVKIIRK